MRFANFRHLLAAGATALLALVTTAAGAQSWPPSPPVKLALNPVTNKVYVLNEFANSVTVIDAATNTTRTIPVGARPQYIAANPGTNRIYVNNAQDATLTVISGATDTTLATLPLGSTGPIQINPLTNIVYVVRLTGPSTDEVTYVNGDNDSFYTIATESFQPIAVAVNPITNMLYVAHYATGDVRAISGVMNGNAHPATTSIGVWSKPVAIAANPMTNKVYAITEDARGPIAIINAADNTATFPAISAGHAVGPRALAINTVTNKIYAAFAGEVIVIDGNTNSLTYVPTGTSGSGPMEIAINHATNKVYVATDVGALLVLDGATNATTTIPIPMGAVALAVNSITNKAYVHGESTTVVNGSGTAAANPLRTTIRPEPGDTVGSDTTFSITASSSFSPNALPVRKVYYQLDSTAGAWKEASNGGTYTARLTGMSNGSHTLYAFATDGQDATLHTSSGSAPFVGTIASYNFTVGTAPAPKEGTTVSLTSSLNPSTSGQGVTFTATVSGTSTTPGGSVSFTDGGAAISGCSAVALASGRATCTTSSLTAGTHSITASYAGSTTHNPSTSSALTQTVNQPAPPPPTRENTSVSLMTSVNPSNSGQGVTFTATVSGTSTVPTGSVAFKDGSTAISGCSAVALTSGQATCTTAALSVGTHSISASYGGSTTHNASTSGAITQTVNQAPQPAVAASMISPTNGGTLKSPNQTFSWTSYANARYELRVGNSIGDASIGSASTTATTATVKKMPSDGRQVYVRLTTIVNGTAAFKDYVYTADGRGK